MKICLVSRPNVSGHEQGLEITENEIARRLSELAPLGVLNLAAVLEQQGTTPHLVDVTRQYYDYLASVRPPSGSGGFLQYLTRYFESRPFDVFGLATIGASYPLTIRLGREIKRLYPDSTVILGGPQASAVDVETLKAFPFIDFMVRGEAEETFPRLLDAIAGGGSWQHLAGITFRRDGEVIRNPDAPAISDLDALPFPAYHLYPYVGEAHRVALEAGRGCPYTCKFCSTNDYFKRDYRLKSPKRLIDEMKRIRATYGIREFELIHDMFTANRRKIIEFCEALLACGEEFFWGCSARTDCVDDDLMDLMARAGCRGIFYGIETGTPRMQRLTNKRLDLDQAALKIERTYRLGMRPGVSLITGFPEETMDDLDGTVSFYVDSLRFDNALLQLHILAPLAGTAYYAEYRDRLVLDDVFSDLTFEGWRQDPADRELIVAYPEIFPNFYGIPTPLDRQYLKQLREFLLYGTQEFRWLLAALQQDSGRLTRVFDEWRMWYAGQEETGSAARSYETQQQARPQYRYEFFRFVKQHYVPRLAKAQDAISTLVDVALFYHEVAERAGSGSAGLAADAPAGSPVFGPDIVPVLAQGVFLRRLAANYNQVIECLRTRGRLDLVSTGPVVMAARVIAGKPPTFIQLTAAAAELIRQCDGRRSVSEIAYACSAAGADFQGIPPEEACVSVFGLLSQQGLVLARTDRVAEGR